MLIGTSLFTPFFALIALLAVKVRIMTELGKSFVLPV